VSLGCGSVCYGRVSEYSLTDYTKPVNRTKNQKI
jgi:hypothetical protein